MGRIDVAAKKYLNNVNVAVDIIHLMLPGLEVNPEDLEYTDPSYVVVDSDGKLHEYHRDVEIKVKSQQNTNESPLVIGIEPHTYNDNSLLLRGISYDAMHFQKQIEEFRKTHEQLKDYDKDSFLSKITIEDVFDDPHTIFFWLGLKPFTGARTKSELLHWSPIRKKLFTDEILLILEPANLDDGTIMRLQSDLREVLSALKYAQKRKELDRIIHLPGFRRVSWEAAILLKLILNIDVRITKEKDGTIDMCRAIDEMKEISLAQGIGIGTKRGREEGIEIGTSNTRKEIAKNFLRLGLSVTDVAENTGLKLSTVEELKKNILKS